ncbi:MAG: ATP-dependent helicase [Mycobacteriaceae bacterium]|nr:ATP-dependent helicase [Mycobacteriaceae bacterium]
MPYSWGEEAQAVLKPGLRGLVRILGGPGTGKSSLVVDAARVHLADGVAPESVLLLTGSSRMGSDARAALTTALLQAAATGSGRVAIREPLVQTVASYASTVVRKSAGLADALPPNPVTGAAQDSIIRELLADECEAARWPAHLQPALGTAGFATELRQLLAQCSSRGVDPRELERLGHRWGRPEWSAAGQFAARYAEALGVVDCVGAALAAFTANPELLAAEHARVRLLLVDDAHQLNPQAARLVHTLAAGTELALLAIDPNQQVFALASQTPAVTLTMSRRCAPAIARAISGIASRLPGGSDSPGSAMLGSGSQPGSVLVRLVASAHAEATLIADTVRRAHLIDGVPWSRIAVIMRSAQRVGAQLPRVLAAAGVPVAAPVSASPNGKLADVPVVRALLTVLTVTGEGLTAQSALDLVSGPIGGVDPVSLRQLHRALCRAVLGGATEEYGDLLKRVLTSEASFAEAWAQPLRRVRETLDAAARCHHDGMDPQHILWAAWHRSGLPQRLLNVIDRGGPLKEQAASDLDAVTELFEIANRYVCNTADASLCGLVQHVAGVALPAARPRPAHRAEHVALLGVQDALEQDWDLVILAGLQQGVWPNAVRRDGVLAIQRLREVVDGGAQGGALAAEPLVEERRLLVAAMGRARHRLVVTAVTGAASGAGAASDEAAVPSEFFDEISDWATGDDQSSAPAPITAPPLLSSSALVGQLRAVVCAPDGAVDEAARGVAATQLARLAKAGIPGADPASWYGLAAVSTAKPLNGGDHIVTLTPTTVQMLNDCPLRWLVERHGGTSPRDLASTLGSVLHRLFAEPSATESDLLAELNRVWKRLPFAAQWYSDNELARYRAMVEAFVQWRSHTRHELTEVGVEVAVDGVLDVDGVAVRLAGRIDRVERDGADRLVIVDIKTGKTPASKDDAQRHVQLGLYQLAVVEGLLAHSDPQDREPGGALLVYPGRTGVGGPAVREQDPLTPAAHHTWRGLIRQAAIATLGPQFIARQCDGCTHCPVRRSCPAHA